MNLETYDLVIIGGGPAGSAAAIYLARYGFKVCLFEKKAFPREILCGEFLSKEVIEIIKELNLFDKFLSLKPNPIDKFCLINEAGSELKTDLNFKAYGLKRSSFDFLLLTAASDSGVAIFKEFGVSQIKKDGETFYVSAKNADNEIVNIQSDIVIAAYGKQNILDKVLKRDFVRYKSPFNGIKFHIPKSMLVNLAPNVISMFVAEGIYCGLNEVNENAVNVCFIENRSKLVRSSRQNLIEFIMANRNLKQIFSNGSLEQINNLPAYGTGNIYFGRKSLVENSIFMIGDAAGVIAPLAGDGIGMALQSAKIVSKILLRKKLEKFSLYQAEKLYVKEWRYLFTRRIRTASAIQKIILNKNLGSIGIKIAKTFPGTLPKIVEMTRGSNNLIQV